MKLKLILNTFEVTSLNFLKREITVYFLSVTTYIKNEIKTHLNHFEDFEVTSLNFFFIFLV